LKLSLLVVGGVGLGLLYLWWTSSSTAPALDPALKKGAAQSSKAVPGAHQVVRTGSASTSLENEALALAGPSVTQATGTALERVGATVTTLGENPLGGAPASVTAPVNVGAQATETATGVDASASGEITPLGKASSLAGGSISGVGEDIAGANPIVGEFVTNVLEAGKFRGASEQQQGQILGNATLQTIASGASAIPVVGAGISAALKALAGTGTGAEAVAAVGEGEEKVYEGQKLLLKGDVSAAFNEAAAAFSGGGSTEAQRHQQFFQAIDGLVMKLSKGGTLTAANVASLKAAESLGYHLVDGFDLNSLKLTAGTNPFLAQKQADAAKAAAAQKAQAVSNLQALVKSGASGSLNDPNDPTGNTVVQVAAGKVVGSYQRTGGPSTYVATAEQAADAAAEEQALAEEQQASANVARLVQLLDERQPLPVVGAEGESGAITQAELDTAKAQYAASPAGKFAAALAARKLAVANTGASSPTSYTFGASYD